MADHCISVVIPCFNAGPTLAAALESAVAQDVPAEIVVIDDGSTDNSLAVARRFEPRIRVVTGPNRGASLARNRGIAEATAEWLVFLDSDDVLEPGTLGKRLAAATVARADVVICDWIELYDDGQGAQTLGPRRSIDWAAFESDAELAAATHVWATTAAILYHRRIVEQIGGFRAELPIIQDARYLFDAAFHGARFVRSDHVGARYRVLSTSLSRRAPERFWRDILVNGTEIEAAWRARGALSLQQVSALADIYNNAARGLFIAESSDYFAAVRRQRLLRCDVPLHSRIAAPLAHVVGLSGARRILGLVGR